MPTQRAWIPPLRAPGEFSQVQPQQDNEVNPPRQEQIKGDFSPLLGLYRKDHDELLENALLM